MRIPNTDDPLYPWKKHSGFKKGLLTDIVLGDKNHGQYDTTMQEEYTPKTLIDGKCAGKSCGFDVSDRKQKHIQFGDDKIKEQVESVTQETFKTPLIPIETQECKSSIQEKYHTKPQTITSAAHLGTQTRQDLPLDQNFFKNFTTTTQDCFKAKKVPERVIYGARPSKLHFGDMERPNLYTTIHDTSFVAHQVSPVRVKGNEKRTVIYNTNVSDQDRAMQFTTTFHDTYKGQSVTFRDYKPLVSQKNGTSHIQFGQPSLKTESSVTKRDYKPNAVEKITLEKASIGGIQKAIMPGDPPSLVSHTQSVYKAEPIVQVPAAGISLEKSNTINEISSLPSGDDRFYDMAYNHTTSKSDFKGYPYTSPTFPILGANMTKSKVFSHIDKHCDYVTTTQSEFQEYDKEMAKRTRGVKVYHEKVHVNGSSMELETTQHAHYQTPEIHKRTPILPLIAQPNKLFPLTREKRYETTTLEYFNDRSDLYFKPVIT